MSEGCLASFPFGMGQILHKQAVIMSDNSNDSIRNQVLQSLIYVQKGKT